MGKKIGVLLIIISLGMIGVGAYMYYFNPKKVMLEALAHQVENFKIEKEVKEKVKVSTNATLTFNQAGNNMTADLKGDMYIDQMVSKFYANYVTKLNNETLVSPELYFEKDKLYFKLKELSDKLNYIEFTDESENSKITQSEFDEFVNVLKDSIVNNVENDSFSRKKESITINKNSFKTTKYTLSLKAIELYNVCNEILTEIKNNPKLLNIRSIIFKMFNKDTYSSDLKKSIIGDESEDKILFYYSIYLMDKNEIIKHEFEVLDKVKKENNIKITFAYYEKKSNVRDYEFILQYDNKNIIEFVIDSGDEDYNINILFSGGTASGKLTKLEKGKTLKLDFFDSSDKNTAIATLNYKIEEIKENSEYQNTINFNLVDNSVNLSVENKIYKDQDVPKFDISKAEKFKLDSFNTNDILNG